MKRIDLKNRIVLITGSSRGIGREMAIACAKKGATVILNGRKEERLAKTCNELQDEGFSADYFVADITSEKACSLMIAYIISRYGRIDVLINNGSASMEDYFEELQPEMFREVLLSNSYGAALPTLLALPHLEKTNGSVIFISSLAGFMGVPKASAYCMGKMASTALHQSLSAEYADRNVHFGICHVSFTQNDTDKMVFNSDGTMKSVADRPEFIQQSQRSVAASVVQMVERGTRRKTLSPFGKVVAFLMRRLPALTEECIRAVERIKQRRSRKKIKQLARA